MCRLSDWPAIKLQRVPNQRTLYSTEILLLLEKFAHSQNQYHHGHDRWPNGANATSLVGSSASFWRINQMLVPVLAIYNVKFEERALTIE